MLHFSTGLRQAVLPILVLSQTVPTVLLAPILAILLGYGLEPKLVVVAIVCFFPIVVNTVDGLRSTDPELVRMMRTLHGGRLAIFRRVEFPGALPAIFSGARVAATYAAVGAIFGEWAGSSSGLGFVILQAEPALDTARIFAAVLILSALALALYALVSLAERLLVPWSARMRRGPVAVVVLAAVLALASAASAGPEKVSLTLDWTPNPDHVGIYDAQQTGLFARAGLDVSIRVPSDPTSVLKLVGVGESDLGISYEQELFLAAAQGLPVVAVAAVVPQPLNSLIAIEPGIHTMRDLDHHTIGITGVPSDYATLKTMLASVGLGLKTSRSSRSATTCCRRYSRTRSTPYSASTATSRGSSYSYVACTRRSSPSTAPVSRATTNWCSSPTATGFDPIPATARW